MKLYNDYGTYLKKRFGSKVYRIGLDAGFSCPNRDGTKGLGGCVYCDEQGSRSSYTNPSKSIREQLAKRIEYLGSFKGAEKFIAYFQAFTNTHAPVIKLKAAYDEALGFDQVVGMSIGTRPDCVDENKLDLIASYKEKLDVWIEYGLQSMHDKTLSLLNRGHDFSNFLNSFALTKKREIPVCVHVILGLPGETRDEMMETAKRLTALGIDAVKIHLFHVLKGSAVENMYGEEKIKLLEQDEYVNIACDFLENLSSGIIIQRLTGEGTPERHIAPAWALDKTGTINKIKDTFISRGTYQGYALSSN